ncbi:EF hand domain-containing protein [Chitinophaga dinghuensis]|uniref:EF hand domain-containing protein n=2 Tax=Chitinophaga dinghuensis TaxID=1539050 RepID=A0A327W200_9BACT|nr:EF hand domain-containing protein [Chitinophaga dinghuensis]
MKHFFAASMLMATMVTVKTYAQEAPQQPQQHQQQGDREAFFKKIDKDGDGKLSKAEVEAASKDDKRLAKLNENFDSIDTNKDGFIDKDELKAFRKSQRPQKDGGTK